MLWTPKDGIQGKCYIFSQYKQRNKVSLVYLLYKLQEERYGLNIFKLKCNKTVERTYSETMKPQKRYYRLCL